jgi:hypothetical protein
MEGFQNPSSIAHADIVSDSSSIVRAGSRENRRPWVTAREVAPGAVNSGNPTCGRTRIIANREISEMRIANRRRFIEKLAFVRMVL